ncbi:MAG: alanine racemase [Hyphomicrobiaceae bacterium]
MTAVRILDRLLGASELHPAGRRIEDLETPVPVVDLDIALANLVRWQDHLDGLGIANRPHIKTHKLALLAQLQVALGARGITVQKLGEAEVMAEAGLADQLLTFNVVGAAKLARLKALARRIDIAVVADSPGVVEGLAEAGRSAGRDIRVLVECDTGAGRCGVQTPQAARDLALAIDRHSGVTFGGLMTYPKSGTRARTAAFLEEAVAHLRQAGLEARTVSSGGSPDMWSSEGLSAVSEYRAGTYIYNDRSLVARGTARVEDCALTVAATVVSRPTPGRAILDSGSKALTSDLMGLTGFGSVPAHGDAVVYEVSEEHGFLGVADDARVPAVGEVVRVLPNHCCPVSNLFDRIVLVKGGEVIGSVAVDARGRSQ